MQFAIIGVLCLAGLYLLLQSLWLNGQHMRGRATLSALTGLCTLAASLIWVMPALFDTEAGKLRERVATLEKDVSVQRIERVRTEAENKKLGSDVAIAGMRLQDMERKYATDFDTITAELTNARSVLTTSSAGVIIDPAPSFLETDKAAEARARIRNLASVRARQIETASIPVPQPQPERQDRTRELTQLRDKMAARMSTPSYDVEAYPDRELVRGRQGRYYVVDLKNSESGVRYFFEGGKYTLPRGNQEFRTSLNTFIGDILTKFEGQVRYDIYVRGRADAKPYRGQLDPAHEFRQIKFVKSLGNDRYGGEFGERRIADQRIANDDLPDLRAAFMQQLVASIYPVKPPVILEGTVSSKADDRDRNVELMLYVDW